MSRTYRRKKHLVYDKDWVLRDWASTKGRWMYPYKVSEHSTEGRKRIAKYLSDSQDTFMQAPKWFKDIKFRRPTRRKDNQILHQIKVQQEELDFPSRKKSVLYDWW